MNGSKRLGIRRLRLRAELDGIQPPVWRLLRAREDLSLGDLHLALQACLGWWNYHLYEFELEGVSYGEPEHYLDDVPEFELLDARVVVLSELGLEAGHEFRYVYDMGDYWEIRLRVEAVEGAPEVEAEEEEGEGPCSPPVVCLDGARRGPPEDCGGCAGFRDLLAALRDPGHPEHREWRAWLGPDYDPEEFSTDAANGQLAELFGPGGEAAAAPLPTQVTEAVEEIMGLLEAASAELGLAPDVLDEAAGLLEAQARRFPEDFLRTKKLGGWAAGAVHATSLSQPSAGGADRWTLAQLGERFGVSPATAARRSLHLRWGSWTGPRVPTLPVSPGHGLEPGYVGETTSRDPVWFVEEVLLAAEKRPSADGEALYLEAAELLEEGGDLLDDDTLRYLLRRGLETESDRAFSRFLALALREFGAEATTWVPLGSGRRGGRGGGRIPPLRLL